MDALFANTVKLSVGGGVGYTEPIRRELGFPEGYVLSPLLFSLMIGELLEELEASGYGLRIINVWCGGVGLMDDFALLASSVSEIKNLLGIVANWCWRRRFELSIKICELLCAGPGCDVHTGRTYSWFWAPSLR